MQSDFQCFCSGARSALPTSFLEHSGHPGGVRDSSRGLSASDTPGIAPTRLTPEGAQNDGGTIASSLCDPSGVDAAFEGSGGIAALNPRLLSANPPGSRKAVDNGEGSPKEVGNGEGSPKEVGNGEGARGLAI
jgi:hypothetical protein